MITGNTYDKNGVFRLLRKAAELGRDSIDIAYAEGRCFMDYMKARGAYTEETAIDLREAGMKNPDSLNTFIHSKKVCRTSDGRFFLPDAQSTETLSENRLISDLVRFGYGYRTLPEGRQYYAWHGSPDRNDDWIIYAEITESEYHRISIEYPQLISADRDTADRFRDKYIRGHKILKEGWNVSL